MSYEYVLITAARNEECFIPLTIEAIVSQTIKPQKWIIVSDRSTDNTNAIIRKAAAEHNYIELLSIVGDDKRNFGSQVRAINHGYEKVRKLKYNFIGNIDADVSFGPQYFEMLFAKFNGNPNLGLAGGFICEEKNGKFLPRPTNNLRSVPHAVQMFRRECFEAIGGYIPLKYGGPDWCAEIMVRMNNWEVSSFQDLEVRHHRPTTAAEGYLHGCFRLGRMDYSFGSHPVFEIIKCFRRIKYRPIIIGSFTRFLGYMYGYIVREERGVPTEIINYLRREQVSRIRYLLFI